MALRMTATGVVEIEPGLWAFDMPPHQVRVFGNTNSAVGTRSVIIFKRCDFDTSNHQLHFSADDVTPINIGTSSQVLGLFEQANDEPETTPKTSEHICDASYGPGDREFLRLARRELRPDTFAAASKLLEGVRKRSPGDLKR